MRRRLPFPLLRMIALLRQHGGLSVANGKAQSVVGLVLSALSALAVLAFHYPQYLTTPLLRAKYNVDVLRWMLLVVMVIAGGMALWRLARRQFVWLNAITVGLLLAAVAAGGHRVPVGDFPDTTPYVGVDYFVLSVLLSFGLFTSLEKRFPLRADQPVFRAGWQTDAIYFVVNHLLVGFLLLLTNWFVSRLFGWSSQFAAREWVHALPLWAAVPTAVLVADLAQYATHRAFHEVPALWRIHSVHHSVEHMDWLAGSRMHVVDMLATRVMVLGILLAVGFSKTAIDIYIVIVGMHAVLNHCNVKLPWGPLRNVIVTPEFHHWHHASDEAALDRNYAAHFSFIDRAFGTMVDAQRWLPEQYGVLGNTVPSGYIAQTLHPFRPMESAARERK